MDNKAKQYEQLRKQQTQAYKDKENAKRGITGGQKGGDEDD